MVSIKLTCKEETDIDKCKQLWNSFSKNETLYDLWDMRYAIYLAYNFPLHFYVFSQGIKPVALVPLWYNPEEGFYEFFGGFFPEENYFFCQDKTLIPEIIKHIPTPAELVGISPRRMPKEFDPSLFIPDEPKYISYLDGEQTIDQFLLRIQKKARHNIRYLYKRTSELKPTVEFVHDLQTYEKYMNDLRVLSIKRFKDTKEPSAFEDIRECEAFTNIFKLQGEYEAGMVAITVGTHVAAVDLVAFYKKRAYLLTGASDLEHFPGMGMYILYQELEDALKKGAIAIDCLQYDYGWKHRYFDEYPMLKLKK